MQTNDQILSLDEQLLTERLKNKIIHAIGDSSIPLSKYIELALYEKDDGYYTNLLHKFGKQGDFVTAPVVSGLFALCIAQQVHELWNYIPKRILEIGAGNGQLMLDLLLVMGNEIERYYILELSANLIRLQQQRLQSVAPQLVSKVVWLDKLPTGFDGVILANEVLDAQPSESIEWSDGEIKQRCVTVDDRGNLVYTQQALNSPELNSIAKMINVSHANYISEINLNNRGFVKSLADTLNKGFILLIDYGYSEKEYYSPERSQGTIRGFFRHQLLEDILIYPGLIDITSSVDFTAVANTAIENKLDFIGYTNQAGFLLNCGLMDIIASQREAVSELQYLKLTNQVNYLTSPNEMGEVFKAIGFSKGIDLDEWLGFRNHDRSYTL